VKFFILALLILVIFVTVGVSKTPKSSSKAAEDYLQELSNVPNSLDVESVEKIFLSLFGDLKKGATETVIRDTYASHFYFNDTFRVLHTIEELIPYMMDTATMVRSTTVEVLDVSKSETDYYVRWVMEMEFDVKRKQIYSKSIGMTQLRFDSEAKIIFHQDFWDSTEGFFQHLPYIGYFIRKVRSKL
jgi:hypothetical protein